MAFTGQDRLLAHLSAPAARQSGTADTPSHLHINRRVGGPFPCKLDLVSTSSYFREVTKRDSSVVLASMTGWFMVLPFEFIYKDSLGPTK